jgi:V/A-type H+-transporting ATPase subunit C
LKERFGGEDLASAYVRFGRVHIPVIKTAVTEEDLSALSVGLADATALVLREFPEREDPKWIDFVLDRRMYERFVATTCREGNLFFYELVRREIDVINILSLFRIRRSDDERGQFVEAFLEGGTLSRDVFLPMFDEPLEAVPSRFAYTAYRSLVEEGWGHLDREGSFAVFERAGQDMVLEYLRRAKLIAFGVEPLIAYLYAKENEIRMIRTIMVGKLNHVESSVIKESLPRVYA